MNIASNHDEYFGFNKTHMIYPFYLDKEMKDKFRLKNEGLFQYPDKFIPAFVFGETCKHGNLYDPCEESLILICEEVTLYLESHVDEKRNISMYSRPTEGQICPCVLYPDTHAYLLHNISTPASGRFVCYSFLHYTLLTCAPGKFEIEDSFEARRMFFSCIWERENVETKCSSLELETLKRAVVGFARNIKGGPKPETKVVAKKMKKFKILEQKLSKQLVGESEENRKSGGVKRKQVQTNTASKNPKVQDNAEVLIERKGKIEETRYERPEKIRARKRIRAAIVSGKSEKN